MRKSRNYALLNHETIDKPKHYQNSKENFLREINRNMYYERSQQRGEFAGQYPIKMLHFERKERPIVVLRGKA